MGNVYVKIQRIKVNMCFFVNNSILAEPKWCRIFFFFGFWGCLKSPVWLLWVQNQNLSLSTLFEGLGRTSEKWEKVSRRTQLKQHTHTHTQAHHTTQRSIFLLKPRDTHTRTRSQSEECVTLNHSERRNTKTKVQVHSARRPFKSTNSQSRRRSFNCAAGTRRSA